MERHSDSQLQFLWKRMMSIALYRGITYTDAEDVVSESFRSGLETYESAKGDFAKYCSAILHNRIINYWRDRRNHDSLDAETIDNAALTPHELLEIDERIAMMDEMVHVLQEELSGKEREFLRIYAETLDRLGKRAVSEAARKADLTVTEGHNVFRKIKRRAKVIYPLSSEERMLLAGEPAVSYVFGIALEMEKGFDRFEGELSTGKKTMYRRYSDAG